MKETTHAIQKKLMFGKKIRVMRKLNQRIIPAQKRMTHTLVQRMNGITQLQNKKKNQSGITTLQSGMTILLKEITANQETTLRHRAVILLHRAAEEIILPGITAIEGEDNSEI